MSGTNSNAEDIIHGTANDAREQIAELRRKVEDLLAERTHNMARAVDRAEIYAGDVAEKAQRRYDEFQDSVRSRPATSLLIAAVAGYILARLLGR